MSTIINNYDVNQFENFSSSEEKEKTEKFHLIRIAFIIIDGQINFLQNSHFSHFEWAKSLEIDEIKFNTLTRGYVLNNDAIFYKANFEFDEQVINDAHLFAKIIKDFCSLKNINVFVGLDVGNGDIWPPKKFLFNI